MDDSIKRNVDAQNRRLAELEEAVQQLLQGETPAVNDVEVRADLHPSYEELTQDNDRLREARGWGEADLDACLTPEMRSRFDEWVSRQRQPWSTADFYAVGLAGLIGTVAVLFDDLVDTTLLAGLESIKKTELLQGWEKAAKGMPIDYTGPKFGGPAHRVRSAGHDIGRPFEALSQIRAGEFRGVTWQYGARVDVLTNAGGRYAPVGSVGEALVLWLKHLAADFVTPMNLPLPGWTKLYELPVRSVRKFAHDAYQGSELGRGLNIRSGVVGPMLSLLTTEAIVRSHVHWDAFSATGSARIDGAGRRKRSELLLAGHSFVGAMSIANAAVRGVLFEGPVAVRHVKAPLLIAAGFQAIRVIQDERHTRSLAPPSWDDLALETFKPWDLDEAGMVAERLAALEV